MQSTGRSVMAGDDARCRHTVPDRWRVSMPANPLTCANAKRSDTGSDEARTVTEIADRLGRHRCTISAEISRNGGRENYRAYRAHDRAKACRTRPKARLLEQHPELAAHVTCRLEAKDSPMTIAVELAQGVYPDIDQTVSHETIYRAIYDHRHDDLPRDIYRCLHRRRRARFHRGTRRSRTQRMAQSSCPLSVQRPPAADARSEVGHLEGDLIIGARRPQRDHHRVRPQEPTPLDGPAARRPQRTRRPSTGLTVLLERIPRRFAARLTWDQGGEMACHARTRPDGAASTSTSPTPITLATTHERERQRPHPPLRRQGHRPPPFHPRRPPSASSTASTPCPAESSTGPPPQHVYDHAVAMTRLNSPRFR